MNAATWSIRNRMLAIALGMALLAWLVGGVVTIGAAREVNSRLRDARLTQLAETVSAFAEHELAEMAQDHRDALLPDSGVHVERRTSLDLRYRYQIWSRERTLLLHSPDAPLDRALAPSHEPGFGNSSLGEQDLRTYVYAPVKGGIVIHVAEVLDGDAEALMLPGPRVTAVMLLSLLGVGAMALWLVMRSLRPVALAESELRRRDPHDLAPLSAAGAPREMRPLMVALNELLHRVAVKLSRERGFTALAAHELRTPLAALRMQAQVAARETDPARRQQQLAAVMASVDRCDHLLEQLLTLARLEQDDPAAASTELDLPELCEQILDDLTPELARRDTQVQVELDATRMQGRPFAVQTLLRNLIANAVAYTPQGATVKVSSRRVANEVEVTVDDSGQGIPPADRDRVFERFVRLERKDGGKDCAKDSAKGVGLGLAIVRAVAEDHRGAVELLDSPLGGLRVRVSFPATAGPAGSLAPAPSG